MPTDSKARTPRNEDNTSDEGKTSESGNSCPHGERINLPEMGVKMEFSEEKARKNAEEWAHLLSDKE